MGIDIGFTDESLKVSKYAACAPYRRKVVAVYANPPEQGNDELAPYREVDKILNLSLLQHEEPKLYSALTKDEPPIFRRETLQWHNGLPGRYGINGRDAKRLKQYVESKPSPKAYLRKMPAELAKEWLSKTEKENLIPAWYDMPYEKNKEICRPCAVRPLDEDNCYIRFSNYPGMNSFRQGFMLTVLYGSAISEQRLKESLFSSPHLDRTKGELPKDKIGQLMEMCEGTPVNQGAEGMFNAVVEMLDKVKPEGVESTGEKINTDYVPFIDEFISKYIYREKPYSVEESRSLFPYMETLQEIADWATWDTNDKPLRTKVIVFRNRMDGFITALKTADEYSLEVQMSY